MLYYLSLLTHTDQLAFFRLFKYLSFRAVGAIVTALYRREHTGKGSHVKSNLMANGVWASSVLAQAKLCGAEFQERRPRERALNAVTNHYKCRDGRWLILSLLNEERQWPALARCLGREEFVTDPLTTKQDALVINVYVPLKSR